MMIEFEYYKNEDGSVHISEHQVCEKEVEELILMNETKFFRPRKDKSNWCYGKLKSSGRYLQVLFRIKKRYLLRFGNLTF